jgi:hypothetical protein
MTSFYDKYFLVNYPNKKKLNSEDINVLKKKYTLNYTDYEKLKISEQYNKLYSNVYKENKENVQVYENTKIFNLSFNKLIKNASITYINLINDLSIYFFKNNEKTFNQFGAIITKNDNLFYIGILILIIAFLLWIINITS